MLNLGGKNMGKVFSKRLKNLIDVHDVISFDIFDTLIKRNCYKPTDIFEIVEIQYNQTNKNNKIQDFKNIRINAEKNARNKNKNSEDITIDEIYDEININKFDKEKVKKLELETELDLCQINLEFVDILNYCKKQNKKVICVSDMYLCKEIIEKILNKFSIKFDKIYISSEIKKTKLTGNLFKYVLEDLKIDRKEIIHIGDSWKADFISPCKIGIKAFHIKKHSSNFKFIKNKDFYDDISCNIIYSFINNNENKISNYYTKLGYEIVGPLCLDFIFWLYDSVKKDKIKNLLFCARDMKMIQEIFDMYFGNEILNSYFYVSRKSIYLPFLYKKNKFTFFKMLIPVSKRKITICELFDLCNINFNKEEIEKEILKYKLDYNKKYSYDELISNINFKKFYDNFMLKKIKLFGKQQYSNFLAYVNSLNYNEKTAIVDLGWRGTTQNMMIEITDKDLYGYYFGLNSLNGTNLNKNFKTYLFFENNNCYFEQIYSFMALIELIMSALHGSTISYDDNITPPYVLGNGSNTNNQDIINIQNGTLLFCKDVLNLKKYIYCNKKKLFAENFINIGINPTYKMAKNLGNIYTENIKVRKLCDCKKLLFYMFHPKSLKQDFLDSEWKVGFMKCLFKIKFPYFKLYVILKDKFK